MCRHYPCFEFVLTTYVEKSTTCMCQVSGVSSMKPNENNTLSLNIRGMWFVFKQKNVCGI